MTTDTATALDLTSKKQKVSHLPDGTPVYMETATAPTNIACIKYWGKADAQWNTPINDSVSITLDQADLKAVTTVAASTAFTQDRLWLNGAEETDAATNKRFRACIDGVKALATDKMDESGTNVLISKDDWQNIFCGWLGFINLA